MSDPGKAVFLSYASQDAEAAKRIADALRAAGVEVWFDTDGGLEHGDEWDAKIRRQIKECVLFLPIISANTQAREEGYFRLEWDLAAERARTIASGVAFILPVVVDDTKEPAALVPDRFRSVQWTKLPGGNVPAEVLQRFLKLWSHRTGALKHPGGSNVGASSRDGGNARGRAPGAPLQTETAFEKWWWLIFPVFGMATGLFWMFRPSVGPRPPAPETPAVAAVAPQSEARQLVERARGLMDKVNALPGDLNTAAGLLEQAAKLTPNDALVWSTWAQLDLRYVALDYDNTPSRHNAARSHAAQAYALDPASRETRYTQARMMRSLSSDPATLVAAEQMLRPMLTEAPKDGRVLIQLGWVARGQGRHDEAFKLFDRAALLPDDAVEATYCKALVLVLSNQFETGDRALDQLLALEPTHAFALCNKAWLSVAWHGDLDAARDFITRIPPQMRVEDMSAFFAYVVYMFRREYDQAVQAIRAVPRDYLSAQPGPGPSGFYIGDALAADGKSAAAEIEWRSALTTVERRLAEAPSDETLMKFKALLLARLGDRAAGERVWKTVIELHGDKAWGGLAAPLHVEFLPPDEAIAWLNRRLKEPQFWFTAAALRLNPVYDPLRANPKFTALVEKMEADPRFSPKAKQRTENGGRKTDDGGQPLLPQSLTPSRPPVADAKSVAVLAFANLSDDKGNEYFSDGISEELLNVLAKIPGLKVSARTSAFYFKGKEVPIPEIAKQLGVAYVVEGSVRKQGDKVRITAQLIKAADGFHVWSDTFTRDVKDIFAVQDEIAALIAQNLKLSMGLAAPAARRAVNPEAHQLVLEGRHFWNLRTPEGFARAEAAFTKALQLDPQFAQAYAGLADVHWVRTVFASYAGDNYVPAKAGEMARRAIELDPTLAEAYPASGSALAWAGRLPEAVEVFKKAIALNPNYMLGHHWYALALESQGRLDQALSEIERAIELDPFSPAAHATRHRFLLMAGRISDALEADSKAVALRAGFFFNSGLRAQGFLAAGRREEALAAARFVTAQEDLQFRYVSDVSAISVLRALGHEAEAATHAGKMLSRLPADSFMRGLVLAALDRWDEAMPYLERTPRGMGEIFFWNPAWDRWRDDSRFLGLMERLGCMAEYKVARATLARMKREQAGR